MKNSYTLEANKRNIPNIELYTYIIRTTWIYNALNCIIFLVFLYINNIRDRFISFFWIGGAVYSIIVAYLKSTDWRKGNRGMLAAVMDCVVHLLLVVYIAYHTLFWQIYIAYGIEVIVSVVVCVRNKMKRLW